MLDKHIGGQLDLQSLDLLKCLLLSLNRIETQSRRSSDYKGFFLSSFSSWRLTHRNILKFFERNSFWWEEHELLAFHI